MVFKNQLPCVAVCLKHGNRSQTCPSSSFHHQSSPRQRRVSESNREGPRPPGSGRVCRAFCRGLTELLSGFSESLLGVWQRNRRASVMTPILADSVSTPLPSEQGDPRRPNQLPNALVPHPEPSQTGSCPGSSRTGKGGPLPVSSS